MISPSPDAFRALARSSPWRWTTLRFTVRWSGTYPQAPVRAWLHRPSDLRVESLDGELLDLRRDEPRTITELTVGGGRAVVLPRATRNAPGLVVDADGLVVQRPSRWALDTDAPMYGDYFWVAMLDPVELADGEQGAGTVSTDVAEVDHFGRPAWEAVVRPTPDYEPRCTCCALLRSREVDEGGAASGSVNTVLDDYPEAYRVRLDVGTGVCVLTEATGGEPMPVSGHEVRIEAADEPMGDALFQ